MLFSQVLRYPAILFTALYGLTFWILMSLPDDQRSALGLVDVTAVGVTATTMFLNAAWMRGAYEACAEPTLLAHEAPLWFLLYGIGGPTLLVMSLLGPIVLPQSALPMFNLVAAIATIAVVGSMVLGSVQAAVRLTKAEGLESFWPVAATWILFVYFFVGVWFLRSRVLRFVKRR